MQNEGTPSCANYALLKTSSDNKNEFGEDIRCTLERDFYVDDCLKSVDTDHQAIALIKQLRTLLA